MGHSRAPLPKQPALRIIQPEQVCTVLPCHRNQYPILGASKKNRKWVERSGFVPVSIPNIRMMLPMESSLCYLCFRSLCTCCRCQWKLHPIRGIYSDLHLFCTWTAFKDPVGRWLVVFFCYPSYIIHELGHPLFTTQNGMTDWVNSSTSTSTDEITYMLMFTLSDNQHP